MSLAKPLRSASGLCLTGILQSDSYNLLGAELPEISNILLE